MITITDPNELQTTCRHWRDQGLRTALVPTMGYFHAGHLSLMDRASPQADKLVVSLFVNPTQFGPNEDLDSYPRDHDRDAALAEAHGVDALFMPEPGSMYAPDHATWIEVPELARGLCGATRPTHFRGVCTVVCKLLHLVQPELAVFGQKDWQQLAIIRRMVRDLNMPVQIQAGPIVREEDGLALSSRNVRLSPEERAQAPAIRQGLLTVQTALHDGERSAPRLLQTLHEYYDAALPLGEADYLSIVDPDDLHPLETVEQRALLAVAIRMKNARLIDNLLLEV
ncbi:pantoate--beta-alanine ligase [Paucidesulfovibrio gracilis DSM 16080]|uniref:Pantothenate synthetase n=1 Tax=Paucidesulfovibrio gracilis DSM 16080 TaxID=1121449 RepID=A0A1T4W3M7_9BACT|nr:pantoate--beta-alanine ligase [Paucidesulfovibrio gracilis]SKA71842.1 pantoate--beta-alanine ligase [Paucidesulfovibrio gracilis DSM 16080]